MPQFLGSGLRLALRHHEGTELEKIAWSIANRFLPGTNFGLINHVFPGPNKQRAWKTSILLSWIRGHSN